MRTLLGVALHTLTLCRADTVWKDEPFLALPLPLSAAVGEEAKKGGIRGHVGRPGTGHGGRQGFQSGCVSVSTQFSPNSESIPYTSGHSMAGKGWGFATDMPPN